MKARVALGFSVHIGKAAVVAVGGTAAAPEILGKAALQVATTFEEGAVFHMGQELPLDEARALIRDSEVRFAERARIQLAAFVAQLGARVVAAGMVAAPPKTLPPIESILKAHPLVHAAEGGSAQRRRPGGQGLGFGERQRRRRGRDQLLQREPPPATLRRRNGSWSPGRRGAARSPDRTTAGAHGR